MTSGTGEPVPLEAAGPLSKSLIWAVQRAGYQDTGIDAWRKGLVPQYVTSNPFIAASYARVVRRYLGEAAADGGVAEPVTIVELGAGSGQFAFHFVRALQRLCRRGRPVPPFRYVLTDFVDANRDAWRNLPALQTFISDGVIDIARFDVESDTALRLETTSTGGLDGTRGVVIANYLFDAIPQDCFTVIDGTVHEIYCAAHSSLPAHQVTPGGLLGQVSLEFTTVPLVADRYGFEAMNQVLGDVAAEGRGGMFLFPGVALTCLERLRTMFDDGLLVLSADRGFSSGAHPRAADGPNLREHGPIFSMPVNYDAIGRWFEANGGVAVHSPRPSTALTLSLGGVGFAPGAIADTTAAFEDCVDALNPDDFFALQSGLQHSARELDAAGAMALLRLSAWDSEVLLTNLGAFMSGLDNLQVGRVEELVEAVERVWDAFYPVEPDSDLPVAIATLLYSAGLYAEAASYLERSLRTVGPTPRVLYDLAMCHIALQNPKAALGYAAQASAADPNYQLPDIVQRSLEASQQRDG